MKKFFIGMLVFAVVLTIARLVSAAPNIEGKQVEYKAGGVTMKGYLAYDSNTKVKRPGVLVVHEWWGINDYVRKRARMLAELGYTALAVDMYGEGKQATHPDDAGKFSSETMKNFDTAKIRFKAAEDFLKRHYTVDPKQIAAIGYCFGGGVVLNMARQGADLKAVASFHGSLAAVKPAQVGKVKAKIRVYNGAPSSFPGAAGASRSETSSSLAATGRSSTAGCRWRFCTGAATWISRIRRRSWSTCRRAARCSTTCARRR